MARWPGQKTTHADMPWHEMTWHANVTTWHDMYHFISFHPVPSGVYQVCMFFVSLEPRLLVFWGKHHGPHFLEKAFWKSIWMLCLWLNLRTIAEQLWYASRCKGVKWEGDLPLANLDLPILQAIVFFVVGYVGSQGSEFLRVSDLHACWPVIL